MKHRLGMVWKLGYDAQTGNGMGTGIWNTD